MSVNNVGQDYLLKLQGNQTASATGTETTNAEENAFDEATVSIDVGGDTVEFTGATEAQAAEATRAVGEVQELLSIGESLGLDLKGVDLAEDLDDITAYTEKLEGMLAKVEALIAEKTEELSKLKAEQEQLVADEAAQQHRLKTLTAEKEEKEDTMEQVNAKIVSMNAENEEAQNSYTANYNTAYAEAEAEYNPETDGDKDAYMEEKMSDFSAPSVSDTSSLQSEYNSLSNDVDDLSTSIDVIKTQTLPNVQHKIQKLDTDISSVEAEITQANADKSAISQEIAAMPKLACDTIKNSVSEEEWALIEENNLDLSATRSDGSPKYFITKGKSDDKYHIYEWNGDSDSEGATSLARKYAPGAGFDIVPSGNGYLSGYTAGESASNKAIHFTMNDCQDKACWVSEKADYCTCSPLAFDLNNNGIETTTGKIMYDIDADGVLDEINNVSEGILAFDKDGDGIVGSNGSELFGNKTDIDGDGKADGYKDGFAALKALAFKENLINGKDDIVLDEKDIDALAEKYGLSMKVGGYDSEAVSLKSLGITEINLASTDETTLIDDFDGQKNQLMKQEGATFTQNGEEKEYVDVWNAYKKK